jgi:hypothetical protein
LPDLDPWGDFMRTSIVWFVVAASLAVGGAARAQADDRAYCERLYATWERYIAPRSQGQITGGVDAIASVEQCRSGNPAGGIPTLERKLRDNRFSLPAR